MGAHAALVNLEWSGAKQFKNMKMTNLYNANGVKVGKVKSVHHLTFYKIDDAGALTG